MALEESLDKIPVRIIYSKNQSGKFQWEIMMDCSDGVSFGPQIRTKIRKITKQEVQKIEPLIFCEEALLVPSSGIIDAIAYMRSLIGRIEDAGGMLAFNSKLIKGELKNNKFILHVSGQEETLIECNQLINSAGLFASDVASKIDGLEKKFIPKTFYAKGNYFSAGRNLGIRHLIYPIPEGFGLGIHLTLELDHSVKFGPDVQWIDNPMDYSVDESRKNNFIVDNKSLVI